MLKKISLTFLICMPFIFIAQAQNMRKDAITTMSFMIKAPTGKSFSTVDSFYVSNGFVLKPLIQHYSHAYTTLRNGKMQDSLPTQSGVRVHAYSLMNLKDMIGIMFPLDSGKSIEAYKDSNGILSKHEPFLSSGLTVTDFSKVKDTVIDGQTCLLIKANKDIPAQVLDGKQMAKTLQLRIAINPALKGYDFPFISEKLVQHFGGGAIVYADSFTDQGNTAEIRYTYLPFTPVQRQIFDRYQALYNSNLSLLDQIKVEHK